MSLQIFSSAPSSAMTSSFCSVTYAFGENFLSASCSIILCPILSVIFFSCKSLNSSVSVFVSNSVSLSVFFLSFSSLSTSLLVHLAVKIGSVFRAISSKSVATSKSAAIILASSSSIFQSFVHLIARCSASSGIVAWIFLIQSCEISNNGRSVSVM